MSGAARRFLLLIGSQNGKSGHLSRLESAVAEMASVMLDPNLGRCEPALSENVAIINATAEETKAAIRKAIEIAHAAEGVLILYFIGHGKESKNKFYFFPEGSDPENPSADRALEIVSYVGSEIGFYRRVAGLTLIIDACASGTAIPGTGKEWVEYLDLRLPFEILTATAEEKAWDCNFTFVLTELIRQGIPDGGLATVTCGNVRSHLKSILFPHQLPLYASFIPTPDLYLAQNTVTHFPWWKARFSGAVVEAVENAVFGEELEAVARLSDVYQVVSVVGPPGAGKTTLMAALNYRHSEFLSVDRVGSILVLLDEASKLPDVYQEIYRQVAFMTKTENTDAPRREPMEVGSLLSELSQATEQRLLYMFFDGFDQAHKTVRDFVSSIATYASNYSSLRVVVSTRDDVLPDAKRFDLQRASDKDVARFLDVLEVEERRAEAIVKAAAGNWLVANSLVHGNQGLGAQELEDNFAELSTPEILKLIYDRDYANAVEESTQHKGWLCWLASFGAGPVMPRAVYSEFVRSFKLYDVGADQRQALSGLLVEGRAGSIGQWVGLFHQTFVDYIKEFRSADAADQAFENEYPYLLAKLSENDINLGGYIENELPGAWWRMARRAISTLENNREWDHEIEREYIETKTKNAVYYVTNAFKLSDVAFGEWEAWSDRLLSASSRLWSFAELSATLKQLSLLALTYHLISEYRRCDHYNYASSHQFIECIGDCNDALFKAELIGPRTFNVVSAAVNRLYWQHEQRVRSGRMVALLARRAFPSDGRIGYVLDRISLEGAIVHGSTLENLLSRTSQLVEKFEIECFERDSEARNIVAIVRNISAMHSSRADQIDLYLWTRNFVSTSKIIADEVKEIGEHVSYELDRRQFDDLY